MPHNAWISLMDDSRLHCLSIKLIPRLYTTEMPDLIRLIHAVSLSLLVTGKPLSKWTKKYMKPEETRGVYVDEFTCIGCKQCVWAASATFRMENKYGRSRVFAQVGLNRKDIGARQQHHTSYEY